jgi:hypothetical protein
MMQEEWGIELVTESDHVCFRELKEQAAMIKFDLSAKTMLITGVLGRDA